MVKNALIDLTIDLPQNPEKYPLDKFKTNNDGTWRAFEKYHYRIISYLRKSNPYCTRAAYK
jgi:hypothetical protein